MYIVAQSETKNHIIVQIGIKKHEVIIIYTLYI